MNPELLALACLLLFFQNPDQQAKLVRAQAQTRMEHESAHTGMMSAESGHGQDDITRVVVMDTADARGTVDRLRLAASLELTAAELHVSVHDLPPILVFHLSKAAAAKLGRVVSSTVCSTGSTTYYEWWIIGEPSNLTYSYMAENTLEDHFKLKVEASERGRVVRIVLSRLDMTVDAKAFHTRGN